MGLPGVGIEVRGGFVVLLPSTPESSCGCWRGKTACKGLTSCGLGNGGFGGAEYVPADAECLPNLAAMAGFAWSNNHCIVFPLSWKPNELVSIKKSLFAMGNSQSTVCPPLWKPSSRVRS